MSPRRRHRRRRGVDVSREPVACRLSRDASVEWRSEPRGSSLREIQNKRCAVLPPQKFGPHNGPRKRGWRGLVPAVKTLGDVPPRFENEVAQIRRLFRFVGYFGVGWPHCRRFVELVRPLRNPWRRLWSSPASDILRSLASRRRGNLAESRQTPASRMKRLG